MNEKEVRARVENKLEDIFRHIEARCKSEWGQAFSLGSQKHTHYWEAFKELEKIFQKELRMAPPSHTMSEDNRRKKRDTAVEELVDLFDMRGRRHEYRKKDRIVSIIEHAQNY